MTALAKTHKDANSLENYCPVSLLCSTYKLHEWMIMGRIAPIVEGKLTEYHDIHVMAKLKT